MEGALTDNAVKPLLLGITVPNSPYDEFQRNQVFSVLLKEQEPYTPRLEQRSFNYFAHVVLFQTYSKIHKPLKFKSLPFF